MSFADKVSSLAGKPMVIRTITPKEKKAPLPLSERPFHVLRGTLLNPAVGDGAKGLALEEISKRFPENLQMVLQEIAEEEKETAEEA